MREISHGFMNVREYTLPDGETIHDVGIFLFVETGEPRATFALKQLDVECVKSVLGIRFTPPLSPPSYGSEVDQIVARLTNRNALKGVTCGASTDVFRNIQLIVETLEAAIAETGDDRICIDISCLPKAYYLAILGWSLKVCGLRAIRFVYSPGKHIDADGDKRSFPGQFTEGAWRLKQVTYLEGPTNTRDDRVLFAFVGSDITKTIELFRQFEPLPKALLYPDGHEDAARSTKIREDLSKQFKIPTEAVALCDRWSAIDALVALRKSHRRSYPSYGRGGLLFPFATKLSAIAAGIFAAFDTSVSMFIRVPEKYILMNLVPDGRVISIEITDMTNTGPAI